MPRPTTCVNLPLRRSSRWALGQIGRNCPVLLNLERSGGVLEPVTLAHRGSRQNGPESGYSAVDLEQCPFAHRQSQPGGSVAGVFPRLYAKSRSQLDRVDSQLGGAVVYEGPFIQDLHICPPSGWTIQHCVRISKPMVTSNQAPAIQQMDNFW